MRRSHAPARFRVLAWAAFAVLLGCAAWRIPGARGGQSSPSLSRPGQEELTYWAGRNGLEQLDVEGEVGFGDMSRILMRRRSNSTAMAEIRDRFTFRYREMAALDTPDLFRARVTREGLAWENRPERFVVAAGLVFNVPLVIENLTGAPAAVQARYEGAGPSALSSSQVPAGGSAGYFLKVAGLGPGPAKGRLVVRAGEREVAADIEFDARPLVAVRVRVVDGRGRPAAARVYVTGADGLAYAPKGSIPRITAMSSEYYFHTAGTFDLRLPSGPTRIEATCGQEYKLAAAHLDLTPGRPAEVRLVLERWADMAAQGWYSADAHIHANYVAPHHQSITPEDVRLSTLAEDLNNANMMVANSDGAFVHDRQFFTGKPHLLSLPGFIIYWNEEMRNNPLYGHMAFFNLTKLVEPVYTGFADTPHWEDYPPNHTLAAEARRQGGAVTYVHPAMSTSGDPTGWGVNAKELPVDLALGQVNAMDVLSNTDDLAATALWYRLLNCGFRLAMSAGTDSFTNLTDHYTPGGGRVYVRAETPLRYGEWIEGYKRGRSFASNGPILLFEADGKGPGEELKYAAGSAPVVRVKATVRSQVPLDKLEIVVNGEVVLVRMAVLAGDLAVEAKLPLRRSSWIAARVTGPRHRLILNDPGAFAHTSPVYAYIGDQPIASGHDARFFINWIERLMTAVNARGKFATEERKREVLQLFQKALEVYRNIERSSA